jgi:hypothetical protein
MKYRVIHLQQIYKNARFIFFSKIYLGLQVSENLLSEFEPLLETTLTICIKFRYGLEMLEYISYFSCCYYFSICSRKQISVGLDW